LSRTPIAVAVALVVAVVLAAAPAPTEPAAPLDLKPFLNQKMKDAFHGDPRADNTLAALPTGKQTFGGVKFVIGDGVVQLGSARVKGPEKVEGIKVNRFLTQLHFLHSCGCGGTDPEGTLIGKYVVRYDDKTTADIDIAYGTDVVDWWVLPGQKDAAKGKVGWEGQNEAQKAAGTGAKIHLTLTTWENPHPKKKVASIDYVSAVKCQAAPFCVAITAEDR
jgi:hypothetical protein